jgi:hypothetical protein
MKTRERVDWSFTDDKIVIFGVNRFYLMNEVLFIILYLILVEKLNWELYCFSNQDKFFIFRSIKHFDVMG